MNQQGRTLIELLIGILLASFVLGMLPFQLRASRQVLTLHRHSEEEAGCFREVVAGLERRAERTPASALVSAPCGRYLQLNCTPQSPAAEVCSLRAAEHPQLPPLLLRSPWAGAPLIVNGSSVGPTTR